MGQSKSIVNSISVSSVEIVDVHGALSVVMAHVEKSWLQQMRRRRASAGRNSRQFSPVRVRGRNFTQRWVLPPEVVFAYYYLEYLQNPVSPGDHLRRIPGPHKIGVRRKRVMTSLADPMLSSSVAFSGRRWGLVEINNVRRSKTVRVLVQECTT